MTSQTELEFHQALLKTPLGEPGSGYARYAAAMWLYQNGEISGDLLEAYRICCKFDDEDPQKVAASRGKF